MQSLLSDKAQLNTVSASLPKLQRRRLLLLPIATVYCPLPPASIPCNTPFSIGGTPRSIQRGCGAPSR
ncbi:MAG: hypothetical protein EPGJADBJ_05243 [Saprospiraceae bacterium]|nr:hypothetical protein [Saprospiraceae bacterium]